MSSKQVVLGVLAGIAAGAMVGMLFSPGKGSETRKRLSGKRDEFAKALKAKLSECLDGFIEKATNDVSGSSEAGKSKYNKT